MKQIIVIKYGSRLAGYTTSRLQVAGSTPHMTGVFSEKKSSLPGGHTAILPTKNRRGELWDSRLTPQLE